MFIFYMTTCTFLESPVHCRGMIQSQKYREKNEILAKISAEVQLFHSLGKTVPEHFTNVSFVINMFCQPVRVLEPP